VPTCSTAQSRQAYFPSVTRLGFGFVKAWTLLLATLATAGCGAVVAYTWQGSLAPTVIAVLAGSLVVLQQLWAALRPTVRI
jgi:hypothetical protein